MTKKELINKLNDMMDKIQELRPLANELENGLKKLEQTIEELPAEANEIEDDKEDQDE